MNGPPAIFRRGAGTELMALTEDELASMRIEEGDHVVLHAGRYWRATFRGFYQPIHLLARMSIAEVSRPTRFCWGYRAVLTEQDAHLANGSMPVYVMANATTFVEGVLSGNRRGICARAAGTSSSARFRTLPF